MSDSSQPHEIQPTRLLHPWNFLGKRTGVGCHFCDLHQFSSVQFSSVTESCLTVCDPMNHSTPGLLSITNSQSSHRLMSIELVMPSSHLIFPPSLLLLAPMPPRIRAFSNESILHMRWSKYWSFSFRQSFQ